MQRRVGNQAVAALVARQALPTLPAAGPDFGALTGKLQPAFERELTRAPAMEREDQLSDALAEAALTELGKGLGDAETKILDTRAGEILSVDQVVQDTRHTVHSALKSLNTIQAAGNQDPDAPDVMVSYGLRLVTRMLAMHAAQHVAAGIAPSHVSNTLAGVENDLDVAVSALTDASSLLDLELEGTLERLAEVREEFKTSADPKLRAGAGAEIGRLARRALLLDRQLTATGKTDPLDHHITQMGPRIAAIRSQAQTEDQSMKAMDADVSLLGETFTPVRHADYAPPLDAKILPEEAFPKATDVASNEFMGDLADRLADQAKQLEDLKGKVIPKDPTYRLDELARIHARWWAFFSAEQERRDMALNTFWNLLDKGWDVLGNAALPPQVAISAAIVRAQMLSQFSSFIGMMMGEATSRFAGELHSPKRAEPDVTGSARYPDYQFAELQPRVTRDRYGKLVPETPNWEASGKGEAASRAEYVAQGRERTAREFSELARHKTPAKEAAAKGIAPDTKPIVGLRTTEAQEGWSYLIDVRDMFGTGDIAAREHKVMPGEVAEYLTAARQHSVTRAATHRPKAGGRPLGEAAIRHGGVEAGEGTAAARYLEGQDNPAPSSAANRLRYQMQTADERIGKGKAKGPTQLLIDDLEHYIDEFFVENQSKGMRVAAIFLMAQREHNVGAQLFALLKPEVLQQLITEAIKVSVIMNVLQRMGPIGALAALAYSTYLKSQGVGNVAALIGIATFMWEASSTDNFRQARAFALMSRKIAGDAAELIENLVSKPIEIGLGKLAEKVPNGSVETAHALEPIMKDPAARQVLIDGANREIERLEAAQKLTGARATELDAWRAFRNQIEQVSRPGDPPLGTDVPLPGAGSTGKTRLDTAFVEPGRSDRSKRALEEGLGDLQGKVPIIRNPDPALGATVRVHYDGGKVRMEVGPEAGRQQIRQHYETARILYRYQGSLGRVLKLIERATAWFSGNQALHGTKGFEAKLEVRKLRKMIDELTGDKNAIEARVARLQGDPSKLHAEARDLEARVADLEGQLKYFETQLGNVEAGRGWVAAEDRRRPKRDYSTAEHRPSRIATLTEATLVKRVGPDPSKPRDPAAHAELLRRHEEEHRSKSNAELVDMAVRRKGARKWYVEQLLAQRPPGAIVHYLSPSISIERLRHVARYDHNAAEALVRRYNREFSQEQLEAMAAKGDGTAQYLLGQVPQGYKPLDPNAPPGPQPAVGPGMHPTGEARLIEGVWERRRRAIEAAERAEQQARGRGDDAAVTAAIEARTAAESAGTLGAMETDIPGIRKQVVRGSPEAPAPLTPENKVPRVVQPPGNQPSQAQFHAEERLLNELDHRIKQQRLKPKDLQGKTVRIAVDQEVCSVCAAGVSGDAARGVILQFSQRYPGLTIEVVDIRSGHYDRFENGTRTQTHRGMGRAAP